MALAHALSPAETKSQQIVRYLVSEAHFYPLDIEKAPNTPHSSGGTEAAREVACVVIDPSGEITRCEGVRYSGAASPENDACQFIRHHRFDAAAPGSPDLEGTIVIMSSWLTQSTT